MRGCFAREALVIFPGGIVKVMAKRRLDDFYAGLICRKMGEELS